MTTEWSVTIDAIAKEEVVDLGAVADRLNDLGASVTTFAQDDMRRMGATFTRSAPTPARALSMAMQLFHQAMPGAEVVAVQVVSVEEQDRLLAQPSFPELAGAQELAATLGVSRQRLYELMKRPDFPQPIVELASGPVWAASSVNHFIDNWTRRPGRPRKNPPVTTLMQELKGSVVAKERPGRRASRKVRELRDAG